MEIQVFPYVQLDGSWTAPDELIKAIFLKMVADKTADVVFYDGKIKTADEFLQMMQSSGNYPVLVHGDGVLKGVAWINDIHDGYATAHFCVFREAWGSSKELGQKTLDYWFSFKKSDGTQMFDLILGVTPSIYKHAIKFITDIGFHIVGEVPKILFHAYQNRRVNAVLSYRERQA